MIIGLDDISEEVIEEFCTERVVWRLSCISSCNTVTVFFKWHQYAKYLSKSYFNKTRLSSLYVTILL